ncbi:carcinoembryonic antigen-related cell adhesion molecule 6-like isoform X2 [Malaclemys terrapin pileata]|uniref:carcinoembryonic antigen-related cell adhesion molecule 6-like isoform X2 n=1 Tax=Malaclemys terrapin pileata TaxID=2991368 RepID=UPI0023A7A107|nr:carcinoembryonic antigen-related cell adhesion molecule 6-like isoform X2 [Malaclemys terrapin pileata]
MGRLPGSWDPPAWGGPWKGLLLAASVLGSCLQPAPAQTQTPVTIVITSQSPAVGGDVSLAPQPLPQDVVSCTWYRSATSTDGTKEIFTYYPQTPAQTPGPAHTGRETAGPGCVLNIAGLTLSDTGNYTVKIDIPPNRVLATVVLCVYEKLAKPTVTPGQTQVPENGTLTLTCNTSPRADAVLWLQNGSYLTPNTRLELSSENRTLTVLNFTWGDTGTYQCEVGNPISTNRSEPSTVTLAYGPESARIDPPGPVNLTLGSRLTLTCIADSVPAPSYSWFLNGTKLPQTGSSFTFDLTTLNLGTYKCQAHNPVTGLTASAEIEVLEKLAKPTVTPGQTQVPENGTLTLTCNTSPSADTVLWLRNGSYLTPNTRLELSSENRTLTVLNFTWGDTGTYQCEVGNPVSTNRSEPSTVTLAYGPQSARIDPPGPVNLTLGSRLTLTCITDSVPAPSYSWFLNGTKLPQTGSSFTFDLTTLNLGTYKCQAHNPVTGLTASAEIEVLAKVSAADSNGGLPPGAIAGIVIGSLAGAALLGGLLYFLLRKTGGSGRL